MHSRLYRGLALFTLMLAPVMALSLGCRPQPMADEAPAAAANPEMDAKIAAAIAELPEAERAAAEAQKICPVSGEPLGSMGTPMKVAVEGRDVFICCESCKNPLTEDPEKYLTKLDEAR